MHTYILFLRTKQIVLLPSCYAEASSNTRPTQMFTEPKRVAEMGEGARLGPWGKGASFHPLVTCWNSDPCVTRTDFPKEAANPV